MMPYRYNDMANFIVNPLMNIDWGIVFFYSELGKYMSIITVNNVFLLAVVILSFIITNKLLEVTSHRCVLSVIFSLLFSISIFFLYRVLSFTPGLYPIFMFPLLIFFLVNKKSPILISLFILVCLIFANYFGFFLLVLASLWYLYDLIYKNISLKMYAKKTFQLITPLLAGIILLFFPILKNNLMFSNNYREDNDRSDTAELVVYRPIEDWYNLSFRPWYFVIPPQSSLFFGDLSQNLHNRIKDTGYYLADDYMEEEMAGSYMGWHFILGTLSVGALLLLKRFKNKEYPVFKNVYANKDMIYRSFFIIFCILLISGPPSFTIGGIEIYTPTYLLYYIVPVFRTLVRWAVVIYLFVLIINSYLVQDLYNLMKTKVQKLMFIAGFLGLNFVIFAIKIPVININKPPVEIATVKELFPESVPYAVYPKGDYYSIFWTLSHEDILINPVDLVDSETGFDSNAFSKELITKEGINILMEKDPVYLIYYPMEISERDMQKISEINPLLKSKEDIGRFFQQELGEPIRSGEALIYIIKR